MTLFERIKNLPPQEHDKILADVWKQFKNTDAFFALNMVMSRVVNRALQNIASPDPLHSDERVFWCGVLHGVQAVSAMVQTLPNLEEVLPAESAESISPHVLREDENFVSKEEPTY